MKVVDIANEIHTELGSLKELSIPPITFWLRSNIGSLNLRINTNYYIDGTDFEIKTVINDLVTEVGINEANILKKMYLIHYYDVKLRESLGAASNDTWVQIESDGTSVRRVNKIQQSQTYQSAKKMEMEDLEKVLYSYQFNKAVPIQVAGNDTIAGDYGSEHAPTRVI